MRQNVPLEVQQILSVNFSLAVGSVSDSVTVTGEAPVLEATNTTIGQVVNQVQTTELPLNGRQFSQLALLAPGAAPVGGWIETFVNVAVGTGGINPSINGITANFDNLDGHDLLPVRRDHSRREKPSPRFPPLRVPCDPMIACYRPLAECHRPVCRRAYRCTAVKSRASAARAPKSRRIPGQGR